MNEQVQSLHGKRKMKMMMWAESLCQSSLWTKLQKVDWTTRHDKIFIEKMAGMVIRVG